MTCFTSAITSCASRIALISAFLISGSCTGQGHRCVEYERTIEHGIYGEIAYATLDGGNTPLYQVKVSLMQFGSQTYADAFSNEDGLYEFALPNSMQSFSVCSNFANAGCWSITVTNLARLDLIIEEGQVFWDDNNFGACP